MARESQRSGLRLMLLVFQSRSRLLLASSRRFAVLFAALVIAFTAAFLSTRGSAPTIQQMTGLHGSQKVGEQPQPALVSQQAQLWITAALLYTEPRRWPWPYKGRRRSEEAPAVSTSRKDSQSQIQFSFDLQKNILTEVLTEHGMLQREMCQGKRPLRALVARCHMGDTCGGIGDRFFGLSLLFLGAVLTGRAFFIDHRKPIPFEDFVEPNVLDWRVSSILSPETRQTVLSCSDSTICDFHYIRSSRAAVDKCPDIVDMLQDTGQVTVAYANLRLDCVAKLLLSFHFLPDSLLAQVKAKSGANLDQELRVWTTYVSHTLLNYLLRVRERIKNIADALMMSAAGAQVRSECTVCIHLRSCKGIGESCVRHYVSAADFGRCAQRVEKQIAKKNHCQSKMAWKVLTDDATAAATLKQYTNFSLVESNSVGQVLHIDKLNLDKSLWRQGMERVFVDFYLLSSCLYMVNSMSTLNEIASIFQGFAVERHDFDLEPACSGPPNVITHWERDTNTPVDRWRALQHVWIV